MTGHPRVRAAHRRDGVVGKRHQVLELEVRRRVNHAADDLPLCRGKRMRPGLRVDDGKAALFYAASERGHLSHVVHETSGICETSSGGERPVAVPSKSTSTA